MEEGCERCGRRGGERGGERCGNRDDDKGGEMSGKRELIGFVRGAVKGVDKIGLKMGGEEGTIEIRQILKLMGEN